MTKEQKASSNTDWSIPHVSPESHEPLSNRYFQIFVIYLEFIIFRIY